MTIVSLTFLLAVFTAIGFFRAQWWWAVIDFFRLQYAVAGLILCLWALFCGERLTALADVVLIAINLWRIRHFLPCFNYSGPAESVNVFSVNAYRNNHSSKRLTDAILKADADVLLMMEMHDELENALSDAIKTFPYRLEAPVREGFRICLYAKKPLEDAEVITFEELQTPLLSAVADIDGEKCRIFSAHPKPALSEEWSDFRLSYFDAVEPIIAKSDMPTIVLGDFNAVPWETRFSQFLERTGLKSTLMHHGYKITWPVYFPILGVPMDHILIKKDVPYDRLHVGPFVGSDHFPVSLRLRKK